MIIHRADGVRCVVITDDAAMTAFCTITIAQLEDGTYRASITYHDQHCPMVAIENGDGVPEVTVRGNVIRVQGRITKTYYRHEPADC